MEQKNSSRKTFMVNTHGFEGDLFQASEGKHPNNVFIAVGGLKDRKLLREFSTYFNCKGIDVLAVYFYGGDSLGLNQNLIPVEYVEAAVNQLMKMNYVNIGITGISKGAEYALLAASKIQNITLVIAFSPSHCVWEGEISSDGALKIRSSGQSGFTWREEPLPYEHFSFSAKQAIKTSLRKRELTCAEVFEEGVHSSSDKADINVEHINGDIFLFSAEQDSVFPSKEASERIIKRLENKGFQHTYKSYTYTYASHILLPFYIKGQKWMFKVERQFQKECQETRNELDVTIDNILNNWNVKTKSSA